MLGDFLALRYLDLGPEPGQVGDWQRPVRKVAAELHAAAFAAGQNHFALIVIDKSATTIEQVLAQLRRRAIRRRVPDATRRHREQ